MGQNDTVYGLVELSKALGEQVNGQNTTLWLCCLVSTVQTLASIEITVQDGTTGILEMFLLIFLQWGEVPMHCLSLFWHHGHTIRAYFSSDF